MHHDDEQIGRVLSRREVLAMFGAAGLTVVGGRLAHPATRRAFGRALPPCVVRPEQTAGPYFVDERLDRSDIRTDPTDGSTSEGVPLELVFRVSRVGDDDCRPLEGAVVDVWQCDALGVYSDVRDIADRFDTTGRKFLRGHQVTDADGTARFTTIYPGWYEGRTVHVHFKIRVEAGPDRAHEFTSQIYFDDEVTDEVMRREPYAIRGERAVRNRQDGLFRRGGERLLLDVAPRGDGYAGTFEVGLHLG